MPPLKPRLYQAIGTAFLKSHKRAMLLDPPGLGKTLQASEAAVLPAMVACPSYLVDQWADFLQEQYPKVTISVAQGSRHKRELALAHAADWYVINIEMLRDYTLPKVTTVIFDESHHLRGRASQQSNGAFNVAQQAKYVYELTGTPISKDPDDLFMQLRILYPKIFKSYYKFLEQYCSVDSDPHGSKITGAKNIETLRRMLANFAIQRSYKEAGLELPDLVEKVIPVTMPAALRDKYNKVRLGYRFEDIPLEATIQVIQLLRQMTFCNEKLQALLEVIADNEAFDAVIFTWYRDSAERIGELLKIPVITGKLSANDRAKTAKGNPMVVATIASLSEGVDLSKSKNVIFFECDYTFGTMHQAVSRVRRYSDDNSPVNCYYILIKNTIDEIIYRRHRDRGITVRQILKEALGG